MGVAPSPPPPVGGYFIVWAIYVHAAPKGMGFSRFCQKEDKLFWYFWFELGMFFLEQATLFIIVE